MQRKGILKANFGATHTSSLQTQCPQLMTHGNNLMYTFVKWNGFESGIKILGPQKSISNDNFPDGRNIILVRKVIKTLLNISHIHFLPNFMFDIHFVLIMHAYQPIITLTYCVLVFPLIDFASSFQEILLLHRISFWISACILVELILMCHLLLNVSFHLILTIKSTPKFYTEKV